MRAVRRCLRLFRAEEEEDVIWTRGIPFDDEHNEDLDRLECYLGAASEARTERHEEATREDGEKKVEESQAGDSEPPPAEQQVRMRKCCAFTVHIFVVLGLSRGRVG